MSITNEPTIAAPPTTQDTAATLLASMAALSGVTTDYNSGSQIRTWAESVGAATETQGIWTRALVFQGMVYGAMALFQIVANQGNGASGLVTFMTSLLPTPPPATQNVTIPQNTIVQTSGGIQFVTTQAALLAAGSSSVTIPVVAVKTGVATNVPPGAVNTLVTGIPYPLFVTNTAALSGGADAETLSETLSRFASTVAALPASSPVAIANAAIGVTDPDTGERVMFSTLFEPWIAAGSGEASGTAGWQLYIDNGQGAATSGLIAAVIQKLGPTVSGSTDAASGIVQYRDAGVPYGVFPVSPIYADVAISGTTISVTTESVVSGAMVQAVSGYFSLPFGTPAEQAQIAAVVGNSAQGLLSSLAVSLYASGTTDPLVLLQPMPISRVLLNSLSISLNNG
jgi:hypothetical protein